MACADKQLVIAQPHDMHSYKIIFYPYDPVKPGMHAECVCVSLQLINSLTSAPGNRKFQCAYPVLTRL